MSSDLQYITDTLIQCSGALKVVQTNSTGLPELMGRLDVSIAKAKGMNDADAALRAAADQIMEKYPVPAHDTTAAPEPVPGEVVATAPDVTEFVAFETTDASENAPPPVSQTDFAKADQTPPSALVAHGWKNDTGNEIETFTVDEKHNLVVT